ncbi:MAG: hypothetical protein A3F84_11595 [Candidatus Handelsmanbacteria bacterium RIFCSPLOWO2_12_FULL_64_10]|uniref:Transport permease protein n=1 Tax=Handelsmanbacteria sp. (strain RIFCSPLOWO2_12_FULL_64_10) TaxID=1817868 RepID=A0A1F6C9V6_HANXR|nr:MAG: hypothetical protein A3F84_11595 [Candidatus Handelsmanbacteria bacterium RIFCSPLOWO2_12_FULL_64_10]
MGALTFYPLQAMLKNVSTVAFGFLFPLAFVLVFGFVGGAGSGLRIGVPNEATRGPLYSALAENGQLILTTGERADLERKLTLGKIEALVDVTSTGLEVVLNSANPDGRLAQLWVEDAVGKLNLAATGLPPRYEMRVSEVAGRRNRYIDFALPGQIGMALISTAVFGTVFGLIYLKKSLVLKRLFALPVRGMTILIGQGIARLVMAIIQAIVILGIGVFGFGFQLANGWVTFVAMLGLCGLGLLVFLGFGLFIAGLTANENAAGPIANLVTLPQFLLSGVFFPTDVFPAWLRAIADSLPLSHLNSAMRQVTAEGAGFNDVLPALLALVVWGAVAYVGAARTFRWV